MRDLTDVEVQALADQLEERQGNVFDVAQAMFGFRPGDGVFVQLRDAAGLGKCVECNVWRSMEVFPDFEESDVPLCCQECLDGEGG